MASLSLSSSLSVTRMALTVLLALFTVFAAQTTTADEGSGMGTTFLVDSGTPSTESVTVVSMAMKPATPLSFAASSSFSLTGFQPFSTGVSKETSISPGLLFSSVQTSTPTFMLTPSETPTPTSPSTVPTASSSFSISLVSSLHMSSSAARVSSPPGIVSFSSDVMQPSSVAIVTSVQIPPTLSLSPSASLPPQATPHVTTPTEPTLPIPIIAGAAGGAAAVIACCIVLVCVVCCCVRRKKRTFVISTGKDGTTLAREYQLVEFNDGVNAQKPELVSAQEVETTTDTFGIKSPPIEIDIGGQKMIFPELPSPVKGGNLPPLIILNPVKPYSGGASTLPTRKKNKVVTEEKASNVTDLFGMSVKLSKSTSEINKEAQSGAQQDASLTTEQKEAARTSTVYDVPCTFKPSKVEDQEEVVSEKPSTSGGATSSGAEYVMMEPRSKHTIEAAAAGDKPGTSQLPPKKTVDLDRLVPKPLDPFTLGATSESIYDNARLIKPKPLISAEPATSVQVDKTESYSLYDVPKKLFGDFGSISDTAVKEKSLAIDTKSVEKTKTEKTNVTETVYDVPKVFSSPSQQGGDSPPNSTVSMYNQSSKDGTVEIQKKETPLILPKPAAKHSNDSTPALEEKKVSTIKSQTGKVGSSVPSIAPKPNTSGNATSQVESVYDHPRITGQASVNSGAESSSGKVVNGTTVITSKPSVLSKPAVESASSTQASLDSRVDNTASSKEFKSEKVSTKPSTSPKPNSTKPSTADKPTILPKPGTPQRVIVPPKPNIKEEDSTTTPSNDTIQSGDVTSVTSSSDKEASDSPEPGVNSPQHDSDTSTSSSGPVPKPRPRVKPKKAGPLQFGMSKNLMQELFAKQNSRTKLSEEKSPSPPAKPAVKPKPNVK